MPNLKSAKKRLRQDNKRREWNRARRSALKTQIRKFLDAVHDKDAGRASDEYRKVCRLLDRNAARGTVHVNMASRKKSRLAARLNAIQTGG